MLSDSMKQIFLELYEEENEYNSNINIKKGIFNVGYHDSFFSGKFMEKDSRICEKIIPEINESINNQSFKDKVVLLTRCHYKKENNSLSIVNIKHVERKLEELTTFEKIIESYKSNFNDYYQYMGINQSNLEFCKDNYSAYCIAKLFYENYKDSVNVNDRFFVPKDEDNPLVELYKTHGIELKLKDEYGLIKVDNNFEIKTINGIKLYDKRLKTHLKVNKISPKFLSLLKKLKDKGIISSLSLRPEYNMVGEDLLDISVIQEEIERGHKFSFQDLSNLVVSKLYSKNNSKDNLWINIDRENITFEELLDDFQTEGNYIVTQVVHLEYVDNLENSFITHIDHEYIFYTEDEYDNRLTNYKQKGKGKKRYKTFKVDNSKIPFTLKNGDFFIYIVLDENFKKKELLHEYFEDVLNK